MDAHDTVVALRAHKRDLARGERAWRHFAAGVLCGIAALALAFVITAAWGTR